MHRHVPHILRRILMKIPKKRSVSLRYVLLGITLPSKPPSNHYATSGLENSEIIEATYFNLALVYKKMHRF